MQYLVIYVTAKSGISGRIIGMQVPNVSTLSPSGRSRSSNVSYNRDLLNPKLEAALKAAFLVSGRSIGEMGLHSSNQVCMYLET